MVLLGGDETQPISTFFNLCLLVNVFNSRAPFSEKRMIWCVIPSTLVSVRAPYIFSFTFKRNRKRNLRPLLNFFFIKVKVLFSPLSLSLFILPFTIYLELLFYTFIRRASLLYFQRSYLEIKKFCPAILLPKVLFPSLYIVLQLKFK